MGIKKESPFLSCIELTVQQGNPWHAEYSLRIIYNVQFEDSNFWFDIYSLISLFLFNKNNTWRPTNDRFQQSGEISHFIKAVRLRNFELNWFHGLSKSPATPFSQVSADPFRFNIPKCSRSLYVFIAFRQTCFARRLGTSHNLSWRAGRRGLGGGGEIVFLSQIISRPLLTVPMSFRYPSSIMLKDLRPPLSYIIPKW